MYKLKVFFRWYTLALPLYIWYAPNIEFGIQILFFNFQFIKGEVLI
jgi:hypothetical protein